MQRFHFKIFLKGLKKRREDEEEEDEETEQRGTAAGAGHCEEVLEKWAETDSVTDASFILIQLSDHLYSMALTVKS